MSGVRVQHLSYAYPGGPPALDDVSLEISVGESVGIVGPNGAGKTTLFLCLTGVLPAAEGMVRVGDLDPARRSDRRRLPEQVGIVFQNSEDQLFNPTVFDDVAFGPLNLGLSPAEVRERVACALEAVGLAGRDDRVPFHLSGGEQRRVALAGVLAMRPPILLLDEPTLHLDPRGRRGFIQLLHQLPGTKLIASHDLELVLESCPRSIILDKGRLVADGPTRSLLADGGLMIAHGLEVPLSLSISAAKEGR